MTFSFHFLYPTLYHYLKKMQKKIQKPFAFWSPTSKKDGTVIDWHGMKGMKQ